MALEDYVKRFHNLRVNTAHGHSSPHKCVMLLAVIQLFDEGRIGKNQIRFSSELLDTYRAFFQVVAGDGDHPNPYFPFFHLQGPDSKSRFWHLVAVSGRERELAALTSARSIGAIETNVAHVELDPELFRLLSNADSRQILRQALLQRWFPDQMQSLLTVASAEKDITDYADFLRETAEQDSASRPVPPETVPEAARDPAFARVVRSAYDNRCAASGWRVMLPDGTPMVEAAHLIPFSVSRDDDPRNGIALSPTFHWALDRHILAPGPDRKWHVAKVFDRRNRDYAELLDLHGKAILLPTNKKYWPRCDALEWRMEHLLSA